MVSIVRAFPILEGKEGDARAFVRELAGDRRGAAGEFLRRNAVTRETWYLQRIHGSTVMIVCTEVDRRELMKERPAAGGFDSWVRERVLQLSGVDLAVTPRGPDAELVFHWELGVAE